MKLTSGILPQWKWRDDPNLIEVHANTHWLHPAHRKISAAALQSHRMNSWILLVSTENMDMKTALQSYLKVLPNMSDSGREGACASAGPSALVSWVAAHRKEMLNPWLDIAIFCLIQFCFLLFWFWFSVFWWTCFQGTTVFWYFQTETFPYANLY